MKPLKAHKYEESRITYPCWLQPKLNGLRALYQNGKFYSQDFEQWNDPVVHHLVTELRDTFDQNIVLDGEIYVHGWLLQQINSACGVTRLAPNSRTTDVQYHVFDRVSFRDDFATRTRDVFDTLTAHRLKRVFPVRPVYVHSRAEADRYYIQQVELGYEGIMYRLDDCPYTKPNQPGTSPSNPRARYISDQNNRVWHMLKRKDWHDDEFLCVGVQEGKETDKGGKLVGAVGSVTCVNSQGVEFNVGSFEGFALDERINLWNHTELVVGHMLTVKYLTLTENGTPFNARVTSVRY